MSSLIKNSATLEKEYAWFSKVVQRRFTNYFQPGQEEGDIYDIPPPELDMSAPYSQFSADTELKISASLGEEAGLLSEFQLAHRLLLLLALAPHVKPAALDVFFTKNTLYDRGFTEFGGVSSKQHGGFLPTGETVMFLLAGGDLLRRSRFQALFEDSYFLSGENVVDLRAQQPNEPFLSGVLTISDEYLTMFTSGDAFSPRYSSKFPARLLQTKQDWGNLILEPHLLQDIAEISTWIDHESTIMNELGMEKFLKPGFRALFYGPPGTGKTLCATLLGKKAKRPVYRIDLSQVVSKYIGETEKNLANLFDRAEHKDWILFFDEADALFGKRTSTKGSNDRYANQEVAYLLQRIEDYNGLVILATNLKGNIDDAFARRFQSMLYFPVPAPEQRLRLWESVFGEKLLLTDDVDLQQIARDYELTGGSIINVARYCALAALRREEEKKKKKEEEEGKQEKGTKEKKQKERIVTPEDIMEGIRRELRKVGKTV